MPTITPRGTVFDDEDTVAYGPLETEYRGQVDWNSPTYPSGTMRDSADLGAAAMIDRDSASWDATLRADAAEVEQKYGLKPGTLYDPSDLEGVKRNASYARNAGVDPKVWLDARKADYVAGATNNTSSDGGSNGDAAQFRFSSGAPNSMQPFSKPWTPTSMEAVKSSEPFKFRLGEAMTAVERLGLAKGTFGTNQTWKAAQTQAEGIASDEFAREDERRWRDYTGEADIYFQNEGNRYTSERTNRMDDFTVMDADRQFGRSMTNDAWSRGSDLWMQNRTDRQDYFGNNLSLADLSLRARPTVR